MPTVWRAWPWIAASRRQPAAKSPFTACRRRACGARRRAGRDRGPSRSRRTGTYGQRSAMTRIIAAALVVLIAVTSAAAAQDYPNRPIKFMHGFPPGGNVDIIGRLLG